MKKWFKLTALCGLFVLLLSIMLVSNIPKTYASSTINSYKNLLKPDYIVYSDWNNEEGEPFIDTDLYFDVPFTISDYDYTTNNTITMEAYNVETDDINFAAIRYDFDTISNNVITYSWDVYETSKVTFYWGAYAIQKSSYDTFNLVIDSISQSGVEEYDVLIRGRYRDGNTETFTINTTIDNLDGLDLKNITDSMDSHFVGSVLVLTDLEIIILNNNDYSNLSFRISSSVNRIDSNLKELLLLNYQNPSPSIDLNFGAASILH